MSQIKTRRDFVNLLVDRTGCKSMYNMVMDLKLDRGRLDRFVAGGKLDQVEFHIDLAKKAGMTLEEYFGCLLETRP